MTPEEKRQLEERRKEESIKNMYYTRYLLVRYTVHVFFFVNLYWTLALLVSNGYLVIFLSSSLLALAGLAIWEQMKMRTRNQRSPKRTLLFFQTTVWANLGLIVSVLLGQGTITFPFLNLTLQNTSVLVGFLALGILVSFGMTRKLRKMDQGLDKAYQRIAQYLSTHAL
ncbi:hypothetical protein [Streptococcus himalayensis]|uniref:PTS cellobiose transporter subunit IIA n=1 Tax=Streptococcus himalayensis TaxID=1888195 RepID=A0A917EDQ2_9STRE|nr:hypothetical protein [Streptococcus himalayensis]GGE25749.1 hypothetical protein GCM10011510_03600 [Streptococcus himalayensis]